MEVVACRKPILNKEAVKERAAAAAVSLAELVTRHGIVGRARANECHACDVAARKRSAGEQRTRRHSNGSVRKN